MGPPKKDKEKKQDKSESPTPPSSVPSVDDEEQKLLERGACGSSHSPQSKSLEKSTTNKKKGKHSKKGSPNQNLRTTSSRNAPKSEPSPEKNLLTVPDQEGGAVGSSSPSKKNILSQLKGKLSPKKRSPNRSSDSECPCESKTSHRPDCPEFNKLEADTKRQSSKRPNDSKTSSCNVSTVTLTENISSEQSSTGLDPNDKENFHIPRSEQPLQKNLLAVPEQENVAVNPRSPAKKSFLSQIKGKISPKKRSPNRSPVGSDCSCMDRNNHELDCPERKSESDAKTKSPKTSSRSETSSSSASPISKKKASDASNTSSENSRHSTSKSSSTSGANVKELINPDRSRTLEWSPGRKNRKMFQHSTPTKNRKGHDPRAGRYRDSSGHSRRQFSIEDSLRMILNGFLNIYKLKNPSEVGEPDGEGLEPVIENLDDTLSEDEGIKPEVEVPRKRSKSFLSNIRIRHRNRYRAQRHSKALPEDGSDTDTQRGDEAAGSSPYVKKKDPGVWRDDESVTDTQRGGLAVGLSPSFKRKYPGCGRDDESDTDTQRGAEATGLSPSAKRKNLGIRRDETGVDARRSDEANWSDSSPGRKDRRDRKIGRDDRRDVDARRSYEVGLSDSSVGRKDPEIQRDNENNVQRGAEGSRLDLSVRKKDTAAWRGYSSNVDTQQGGTDPSVRSKDRKSRQDEESDAAAKRPVSLVDPNKEPITKAILDDDDKKILRNARATGSVSVRRHQSLSPQPFDACQCGSSYIHKVGCSREIRARRRRKWRKCRQDIYARSNSKDDRL